METNFHYPAEYYDEDYTVGLPDRGDISFYKKYAREQSSPVLELGCGTGRILIPIAQTGVDCFGLDMNPDMLEVCRRKASEYGLKNVHLRESSMDDFHYDQRFNLIYIPFRSFQHLLTTEQQLRCLELVRQHLKDDGLFIMDVFAPSIEKLRVYSRNKEGWKKEFSRKNERTENTITRYFQAASDLASQTTEVKMYWEERDSSGILVARKTAEFKLRYIFRYELEYLLRFSGFDPAIYGYFDERPYDYVSGETIAVCRKTQ